MTLVTLAPTGALIPISPGPLPELVTVPTLLILAVERVIPLVSELLLFKTKLPVDGDIWAIVTYIRTLK